MAESFNHFNELADAFHTALSQVVRKAAFDVQAAAATAAPVDTGFLRNSIYVETATDSTYGQGASSPPEGASLLPEIEKPEDDLTAYIGVGANYGIYQEMGTRYMPAHPYLAPAVEQVRPNFESALGKIEEKMQEAGV